VTPDMQYRRSMQRVCIYCGSSDQVTDPYRQAAREMGTELGKRGLSLVYGGGRTGLMGVVADSALAAGSQAYGVLPHHLHSRERAHPALTRLELVDDMAARKARMIELADAFVALPGGYGTMEELFEVLSHRVLDLHRKPIALLDTNGYYTHLLAFLEQGYSTRLVSPAHHEILIVERHANTLLERLLATPR